jgi:hypothetical protein
VSTKTIRRMFASEPGVIRIANHGTGNRKCVVLSIPESVLLQVHERLIVQPIKVNTSRNPRRLVSLPDFHQRLAKRPQNVIKLKAGGAGAKMPDRPQ